MCAWISCFPSRLNPGENREIGIQIRTLILPIQILRKSLLYLPRPLGPFPIRLASLPLSFSGRRPAQLLPSLSSTSFPSRAARLARPLFLFPLGCARPVRFARPERDAHMRRTPVRARALAISLSLSNLPDSLSRARPFLSLSPNGSRRRPVPFSLAPRPVPAGTAPRPVSLLAPRPCAVADRHVHCRRHPGPSAPLASAPRQAPGSLPAPPPLRARAAEESVYPPFLSPQSPACFGNGAATLLPSPFSFSPTAVDVTRQPPLGR